MMRNGPEEKRKVKRSTAQGKKTKEAASETAGTQMRRMPGPLMMLLMMSESSVQNMCPPARLGRRMRMMKMMKKRNPTRKVMASSSDNMQKTLHISAHCPRRLVAPGLE